jgi:hypothetical protein
MVLLGFVVYSRGNCVHSPRYRPRMDDADPPEQTTERRTLKGRPTLVLLLLIGSCYAFGYTIYRLLRGMQQ